MSSILSAALEYAERGFSVFPVRQNKTPHTAHGVKDASTDPSKIKHWWQKYPGANLAVACGRASGNLLVIDVDVKDGKKGDESIMKWTAVHGDFPNTVRAITGSGGTHYFFRCRNVEKYKNEIDILPGVDIRGDGAYVVVAPSVNADGCVYAWEHDVSIADTDEIAEVNQSVISLLEAAASVAPKRTAKSQRSVRSVPKGQRNSVIFKFACALRGQDAPFDAALESARLVSEGWDDPLPESEIRKAVNSAYERYQPNESTIYDGTDAELPDTDELQITPLSDIPEEEVEWLIPGHLPKEQITLICGTGGTGKTSVWVSLLASLSAGSKNIFDGDAPADQIQREPKKVMFFSAEDTVENVIKKRLRKQGANMDNIVTLSISDQRFDKVRFGSKYLEGLIRRYRPELCVFDPLQAFVDGRIKMADRNAMRQNMRCLIEWGKKYGTTFLIVMHTNKLLNVWGRNRMADSADLWDIARCVWMVGDSQDPEIKYLSHEKNNYGKTSRTMLFKNESGMPTWERWTDDKDREFVTAAAKARNEKRGSSDVAEAEEFIMSTLSEYPEGLFTKELDALLDDAGFKRWAVNKAKSMLKDKRKIKYLKTGMSDPWKIKKT